VISSKQVERPAGSKAVREFSVKCSQQREEEAPRKKQSFATGKLAAEVGAE
jgi:hypothetical protein